MSEAVSYYPFICACLGGETQATAAYLLDQIRSPAWDWEELIRAAATENVLPTLYERLQELRLYSRMPAEVGDFFEGIRELSLDRNQRILGEIAKVASLLNSIGIEPVALKGSAYLLAGIYPELSTRFLADIDLLVPASAVSRAIWILKANGYIEDCQDELVAARHHHTLLWQPGQSVGIELHRRLGMRPCDSILSAQEMLDGSRGITLDGARLRLPSAEHLVTHHIMHSQVHHGGSERVWPAVRAMHDLLLLDEHFRDDVNWRGVEQRFNQNRHYATLVLHLALTARLMGDERFSRRKLTGLTLLRWYRRMALRRAPALRYFDPLYLFSSSAVWRMRLVREVLSIPGGWSYVLSTPFRSGFYRNLYRETIDPSAESWPIRRN